jgi:hypothetical protein
MLHNSNTVCCYQGQSKLQPQYHHMMQQAQATPSCCPCPEQHIHSRQKIPVHQPPLPCEKGKELLSAQFRWQTQAALDRW